jgi:hypothetical protein
VFGTLKYLLHELDLLISLLYLCLINADGIDPNSDRSVTIANPYTVKVFVVVSEVPKNSIQVPGDEEVETIYPDGRY